jgi:hypothetical protein
MKGKKFDAAEKHFQKKEEIYIKRIKALEALVLAKQQKEDAMAVEIDALKEQNAILKVSNEKLMALCNLSPEDIQASIQKDKQMTEAAWAISQIMGGKFI